VRVTARCCCRRTAVRMVSRKRRRALRVHQRAVVQDGFGTDRPSRVSADAQRHAPRGAADARQRRSRSKRRSGRTEDHGHPGRRNQLAVSLGGRAAEELVFQFRSCSTVRDGLASSSPPQREYRARSLAYVLRRRPEERVRGWRLDPDHDESSPARRGRDLRYGLPVTRISTARARSRDRSPGAHAGSPPPL
jgi:hypothetical protein